MRKREGFRWFGFIVSMLFILGLAVAPSLWAAEEVWRPKDGSTWVRPKAKKKYTIGALIPSLQAQYWVNVAYGLFDESEKLGVNLKFAATASYSQYAKQANYMEDLIASGVDAIILAAASSDALVEPVNQAMAKGIKVILMVQDIRSKNWTARVISDHYELGYRTGAALAKFMKGKGKIIALNGPPGQEWSIARRKGLGDVLKKNPGIKLMGERWMGVARDEGLKHTEDFLQTFPDITGVWAAVDIAAAGAVDAIDAGNIKKKIWISSASGSQFALKMVKEKQMDFDLGEAPIWLGRWSIGTAVKTLNGEKVPRTTYVPFPEFTRDNMKDWPELTKSEWAPKGWKVPR
jgi:ABC-type sugar transport system substrate-binding protein